MSGTAVQGENSDQGKEGPDSPHQSEVQWWANRTLVWLKFQAWETRGQFPHWAQGAGEIAPGPLIFCKSSGMRRHTGSLVGLRTPQTEFTPIHIPTSFHRVISILGKRQPSTQLLPSAAFESRTAHSSLLTKPSASQYLALTLPDAGCPVDGPSFLAWVFSQPLCD